MSTQVQFRRGTAAENDAFTGAVGEITIDTTNKALRVHDGVAAGGFTPGFEATTKMLFYQTAAPSGWTKDATAALDKVGLRLVTTTAWAVGASGADAFDTVFGTSKVTASHVLTAAQLGAHTHPQQNDGVNAFKNAASASSPTFANGAADGSGAEITGSSGGGGGHTHTLTNLDLKHVNVILCTKD